MNNIKYSIESIIIILSYLLIIVNGRFNYPDIYRNETIFDDFFHTKIPDPYRWLEDATSNETREFIRQQNLLTLPYVHSCTYRDKIQSKITNLLKYERFGCPFKQGQYYYITINSGLQNHSILYRTKNLNDIAENKNLEIFFNPNALSTNGDMSLSMSSFSDDNNWWAYGIQKSGSDWNTLRIRNTETLEDLDETLTHIKFSSISWTRDNLGFFYSHYKNNLTDEYLDGTETSQYLFNKLYYHRLRTPQHEDILIYETPDEPLNRFYGVVSDCGCYFHLFVRQNTEFESLYFHKFKENFTIDGKLEMIPIVNEFVANYQFLANDGPIHYFQTSYLAPNYRIIKINLTDETSRSISMWEDLVPEHPTNVLRSVTVAYNDVMICHYIHDVLSHLQLRNLTTGHLIQDIDIPISIIKSITGDRKDNSDVFFSMTSFLMPTNVYHLDLKPNPRESEPVLFKKSAPKYFNSSKFITKNIFYRSKDGTKVPMFIVHRRDLKRDGQQPALLYGYGGFNAIMQPSFIGSKTIFLENFNGTYAMAGIRGGGEYGKRWHNEGKLLLKQNCFDDFIAAAEYLVEQNYTSPKKIIIEGGSNGGLLVAAVSNQRPDLFGCTICMVGVLDMLRYHKFTIGHAWISEYGNPETDEKLFHYLLGYSPLHNVPKNASHYPATLLLTADHDDRVVPLHSYKYIAELQHRLGKRLPDIPLMIRIETNSGHGRGKPIKKIISENVDIYSFILNSLSLRFSND